MLTKDELGFVKGIRDAVLQAATEAALGVPAVEIHGKAAERIVKAWPESVDKPTALRLAVYGLMRFVDLRAVAREQQAEAAHAKLTTGQSDDSALAAARVA